jgi:hypothetical protein
MPKPRVFIASSGEGRAVAESVQLLLEHDAECTVWNQGFFDLSENTLDDLINSLDDWDFGVFVFSADDILKLREQTYSAPRDNVVLEFGLFAGRLGKSRAVIVHPRNWDPRLRIPTDVLGITTAMYDATRSNLNPALGSACTQIRQHMDRVYIPRPGVYMRNHFMCEIGAGWDRYLGDRGSVAFGRDFVRIDGTTDVGFEFPSLHLTGPTNYVLFRVQRLTDTPLRLYIAFHSADSLTHVYASSDLTDFGWGTSVNEFRIPLTGIPIREWYPVLIEMSDVDARLNSPTTTLTFKMRAPLELSHIFCTDDLRDIPPAVRTIRGRVVNPVTVPHEYLAVSIPEPVHLTESQAAILVSLRNHLFRKVGGSTSPKEIADDLKLHGYEGCPALLDEKYVRDELQHLKEHWPWRIVEARKLGYTLAWPGDGEEGAASQFDSAFMLINFNEVRRNSGGRIERNAIVNYLQKANINERYANSSIDFCLKNKYMNRWETEDDHFLTERVECEWLYLKALVDQGPTLPIPVQP